MKRPSIESHFRRRIAGSVCPSDPDHAAAYTVGEWVHWNLLADLAAAGARPVRREETRRTRSDIMHLDGMTIRIAYTRGRALQIGVYGSGSIGELLERKIAEYKGQYCGPTGLNGSRRV